MKYAGMLLIFVCCAAAGLMASARVGARSALLLDFSAFAEYILSQIRLYGYPLPRIYASYPTRAALKDSGFTDDLRRDPDWFRALGALTGRNCPLTTEDIVILRDFGADLARVMGGAPSAGCERAAETLHNRAQTLKAVCAGRKKLYRSAGFFAGAVVCVILI